METVRLFSEAVEDVEFITEAKENGGKRYFIEGVFLQADIKNRNGRVYPMDVLEPEVEKYNKNFVEKKRAYGELGHPDGPTVNLERASHITESLKREGKNFVGRAKILSTPMGKIVEGLMDDGCKLGVSSRGMGSVSKTPGQEGANVVQSDFYLATAADIVADPSAPNAFVEGIMEGKEWVWDNGALIEEELVRMKKRINEKVRKKHANQDALEFARFLKLL